MGGATTGVSGRRVRGIGVQMPAQHQPPPGRGAPHAGDQVYDALPSLQHRQLRMRHVAPHQLLLAVRTSSAAVAAAASFGLVPLITMFSA